MHPAQLLLETLRLNGGTAPERLRAEWAATPTRGLRRLVEFEGCALWLHRRLGQIGATETDGGRFPTWLARRARADAAGNMLVDAEAVAVARILAAAGIPHVLIKGVARRALAARFPFADARATHDVDVVVPPARAQEAWRSLRSRGYYLADRAETIPLGHFHLLPLWNGTRVAVELHTSTSPFVSPEETWRRVTAGSCEVERDGVRMRIPPATQMLWHALTHAMIDPADGFRLHFLLDGAVILASSVELDWPEIGRRLDAGEVPTHAAAAAWLHAAAWLAGATLPPGIAAAGPPFELERALRWRFAILRFLPPTARLARVLAAAAPPRERARRLGAAAARAAGRLWRAMTSRRRPAGPLPPLTAAD